MYYRRVFRGDERVECDVMKDLKLRVKAMIESKAVTYTVTSYETDQQKKTSELTRRVEISFGQPAVPKLAPKGPNTEKEARWSGSESLEERAPKRKEGPM